MQTMGEYVAFLAALSTVVVVAANWWYVHHSTSNGRSHAPWSRHRG